jgi:hypothetical protein
MSNNSDKNLKNKKSTEETSFEYTFLITVLFCISIFLIIYYNIDFFRDNIIYIFETKEKNRMIDEVISVRNTLRKKF